MNDEAKEELENTSINNRYSWYLKQHKNNNQSALAILDKIKHGYIPNDADVFDLMNENEKENNMFREMFELKERVKSGCISKKDLEYSINIIGFDVDTATQLKNSFYSKGLIVDEYDENKKSK